jgi:diguanylate cyclase (GGDEF)-like protein
VPHVRISAQIAEANYVRMKLPGKRPRASDREHDAAGVPTSSPLGAGTPVPFDKPGRPRVAFRNYHRWLRLSRLAVGSFIFMSVIALLWLVPWLPYGLDTSAYTPQMGFTVYLLGSCASLGVIALVMQERSRRNRESLMVWSTVYDEVTGLHNRTYFFDRLALECERARRSGEVFSVIIIQIRAGNARSRTERKSAPLSNNAQRKIAEVIDGQTHPTDMVSLLSSSELAVLANRIDRDSRHALQERLGDAVAQKIPELLSTPTIVDVKTGAATYGVDGTEPSALVQAARTSAALGVRSRLKAV